ncbi:MAG: ABC transporter, partial [Bacteroidota bacterium]
LGSAKTVILSTHILSEVQATCNRVLIINEGKIVADGSPEQLKRDFTGGESITLELKTNVPDPLEEIAPKLQVIAYVKNVTLLSHEKGISRFELRVDKGTDVREAAFRLAVSENWVVLELYRKATSLEEVFHKLTAA